MFTPNNKERATQVVVVVVVEVVVVANVMFEKMSVAHCNIVSS